jgi:hypothetical protein
MRPSSRTNTLCGLRSRWRTPASCACRSPRGDLGDDVDGLLRREGLAADAVRQRLAAQVLEDQVGRALVLAPVVDGDDVGVIEARGGAGLDVEAAPILVGERAVVAARHELDGDVAPELQVAGEVDRAETAAAEPADDLEATADAVAGLRHGQRLGGSSLRVSNDRPRASATPRRSVSSEALDSSAERRSLPLPPILPKVTSAWGRRLPLSKEYRHEPRGKSLHHGAGRRMFRNRWLRPGGRADRLRGAAGLPCAGDPRPSRSSTPPPTGWRRCRRR